MDEELKQLLEESIRTNQKRTDALEDIIKKNATGRSYDKGYLGENKVGGASWKDVGTNLGRVAGDLITKSLKSGITQTSQISARERVGVSQGADAIKELFSIKSFTDTFNKGLKLASFIGDQIILQFEQESQLLSDLGEKTGIVGNMAKMFREEIFKAYPGVVEMGYGFEQLSKFYTDLIENTGKFTMLNSETITKSAQATRAFVGDMNDMAKTLSEYEKIGLGANQALDSIEEMGVKSMTLGLRAKKTVEDVTKGIEKLNMYGFKNGIQGLASMSRKATEFRMNLEDAFKVAEKVISPEGAIELSAQLQVLGGTLGDFADPLKMMYMATNNVEGLQDSIIGAAKSLAIYNEEQGRFEITGVNLRRARDMAESLGMSLEDLDRTAIAAVERTKAASDLLSTGLQMSDEDREFLTNLGTMKDGKMVIQVPESLSDKLGKTEVELNQMSGHVAEQLLANKEAFKKMESRDIALNQLTEMGKMERSLNTIAAAARLDIANWVKTTKVYEKGNQLLLKGNEDMKSIVEKINSNSGSILGAGAKGEKAMRANLEQTYSSEISDKILEAYKNSEEYRTKMLEQQQANAQPQQVNHIYSGTVYFRPEGVSDLQTNSVLNSPQNKYNNGDKRDYITNPTNYVEKR